jgi:membrane protein DedA with SNARE-associated domain/membrane-associated phospholipid phosphatase
MDALLTPLIDWIETDPGWAYLLVFLVALAESVALIGMLVPGVVVMIGAGALIATGQLAFWPTLLLAVTGAILGDGFSYWIGYRYRDRLREHWPFNRHPRPLERGVAFFQRHGGKSVAFGRFVGPGRAMIPLVAGMLGMPRGQFALANISSALAWGPAYLAPGIVFGASLKLAAEATAHLALLLLIVAALIGLAAWLAKWAFLHLSPQASAWLSQLLRWSSQHPRLGAVAEALTERDHPDAMTLATLALALLAATALLGISLSADLFGPQALDLNQIALDLGQSLHSPLADQAMLALSRLAEPVVSLPLVIAILVYLLLSGQRRSLTYWLAALGFSLVATPLLGWLVRVPRPDLGLALNWPWSFPSAQVLTATILYGFLAVSLSRAMTPGWRWLPYTLAAALIAAVATARLYLGGEWLSDIIGSIALGSLWIAALGLAFYQHTDAPHQATGLALVSLIALSVAFAAALAAQQPSDLAPYRPQAQQLNVTAEHWRSRQPLAIKVQREDLWRRDQRPFDIQYAGALEPLAGALAEQGWRPAEMLHWDNAIKLLSTSLPLSALPLVPHVHDGQHDQLRLVKDLSDGRRLVLRLWSTPVWIDGHQPLWIGNLTELRKETIVGLMALPISSAVRVADQQYFLADLGRLEHLDLVVSETGEPILIALGRNWDPT